MLSPYQKQNESLFLLKLAAKITWKILVKVKKIGCINDLNISFILSCPSSFLFQGISNVQVLVYLTSFHQHNLKIREKELRNTLALEPYQPSFVTACIKFSQTNRALNMLIKLFYRMQLFFVSQFL